MTQRGDDNRPRPEPRCRRLRIPAMSDLKALLLTDVVGSTQLSEKLGDAAMVAVWGAHDRAARDLLPAWRGREIDKTDGMLLMFDGVSDAVHYARAYQGALAGLPVPLPARAGVHYGPVILRENRAEDVARGAKPIEVDGLAKPTAARVMALARGGQILLTAEALAALGRTDLSVQSHGYWVLKGVSEPLELFEVGNSETPFKPPEDGEKAFQVVRSGERWLPVREIPNNLPQQSTTFVGRDRELRELKAQLAKVRLVTLLGMGGLGKTRLSLQVAAETQHLYPDGVWFVDLSPIRDPALVVGETAQVLGVRDEPDRPLIQTLGAYLKTRRVLIVLDNCEHLTQAAADLAHALLKSAPDLRILASSREVLRVPGELGYPVLPLPVPDRGAGLQALQDSPAVRLFVERAQMHKPNFALGERDAPAVAELIARLEGIPLALELAAARVRSLSVGDINVRLRDRYKVLTGGARTLQQRQQTLRALVDWSYDLLNPREQTTLQRLGIFVGGFDLPAAEQICGGDPIDPMEVMDLLASLVEKSLATMEDGEHGTRYRMLETIREYAFEKLDLAGEREAVAARHCDFFFDFSKQGRDGLKGAEQAAWIERLETDLDNLRSAIALALAGAVDPFVAVKMAVALQGFWILRGYATEGRGVIRAALALPAVAGSDMARAWALYVGACLAFSQGDHNEAGEMLESCLELRRRLGEPQSIAATLSTLSQVRLYRGDVAGAADCEREALQIFKSVGDRVGEAIGLQHLAKCATAVGDDPQARGELAEALRIVEKIGYREIEVECHQMLGELDFDAGDFIQARGRFDKSLAICRDAADKHGEANSLRWLGKVDLAENDLPAARPRLRDALRAFESFEMRDELFSCLEDHAHLAQAGGDRESAARLASAVDRLRQRAALGRLPRHQQRWQAWFTALQGELGAEAFDGARRSSEDWDLGETVRHATSPPAAAA